MHSKTLLSLAAAVAFAAGTPAGTVPAWGRFETSFDDGPAESSDFNPFTMVELFATFEFAEGAPGRQYVVRGFYDGGNTYRIRFMPPGGAPGRWTFRTKSNVAVLDGRTGEFTASASAPGKSPVRVRDTKSLTYADGSPHFSVGTTSYAWIHQNQSLVDATLETLADPKTPFNKMRMTIFPKWYIYNRVEPEFFAFQGTPDTKWDFTRFNVSFWQRLDGLIGALDDRDVQADLILFHPYDGGHWGFDCLGGSDADSYDTSNDERYLAYIVARLGSYRNVWWSMANEWDLVKCKSRGAPDASPVWDRLFRVLAHEDPYNHLTSIHNCMRYYNHSRPWITHISSQGGYDMAHIKRRFAAKPVIWDEVMYEGDIGKWGGLTAGQMTDRFWWGLSYGIYVGHGETVLTKNISDDDQVLWWSKGNVLRGRSPERILWFEKFAAPFFDQLSCSCTGWGESMCDEACVLDYTLGDGINLVTDERTVYLIHSSAYNEPSHRPADSKVTLPPGNWSLRPVDMMSMKVLEPVATLRGGASVSLTGKMMTFEELTNEDTIAPCNRSSASCCSNDKYACTPYTAILELI